MHGSHLDQENANADVGKRITGVDETEGDRVHTEDGVEFDKFAKCFVGEI